MCVKKREMHEKTVQLSNRPCGVYEPMILSNQTPTTNVKELDPAYIQVSDCFANKESDVIAVEKDPAYEQHNICELHAVAFKICNIVTHIIVHVVCTKVVS